MATINFRIKSKSNPSPIYIRFRDKKTFYIETKTGLLINPVFWDIPKFETPGLPNGIADAGSRKTYDNPASPADPTPSGP